MWSFFKPRPIVIQPVAVRAGDDLVLSLPQWDASEDLVALLCAAQKQFPGVRIHLLAGFGQAQVAMNQPKGQHGNECADDQRDEPQLPTPLPFSQRFAGLDDPAFQGKVFVSYCSVGRVALVSVPPKA